MRLIAILLATLAGFAAPASAEPVLRTQSGICHCPGGAHYGKIKTATRFGDLESCLATGAREPKSGQGDCSAASPVVSQAPTQQSRPAAVAPLSGVPPYSREAFGDGWADFNRDCVNTRHEILASLSTGRVTMNRKGCSVVQGRWNDPYTNRIFTDPGDLDIDHIVPLSFAWKHGAHAWDAKTRLAFANDPVNLIAVDGPTNRQKSDAGPLEWLPPNVEYRCEYILRFTRISKSYGLVFADSEAQDMADLTAFLCD